MNEPSDAEILAYRKSKFQVEVEPSYHPSETGEFNLRVTHNGYQWSVMSFLQCEIPKVIEALQAARKLV